jgi:hypothetical protein
MMYFTPSAYNLLLRLLLVQRNNFISLYQLITCRSIEKCTNDNDVMIDSVIYPIHVLQYMQDSL